MIVAKLLGTSMGGVLVTTRDVDSEELVDRMSMLFLHADRLPVSLLAPRAPALTQPSHLSLEIVDRLVERLAELQALAVGHDLAPARLTHDPDLSPSEAMMVGLMSDESHVDQVSPFRCEGSNAALDGVALHLGNGFEIGPVNLHGTLLLLPADCAASAPARARARTRFVKVHVAARLTLATHCDSAGHSCQGASARSCWRRVSS